MLVGWTGKVEYYEKRFHKITAATGLTQPEDIVNKFFFNDEITEDLQHEINKSKSRIAELDQEAKDARSHLTGAQDSFEVSKWSDVGSLKAKFDDSQSRHSKERTEQITRRLEDTLGDLPDTLRGETEDDAGEGSGGSVWWAAALEKRIDHLLSVVRVEEDLQQVVEDPNPERKEALSNFAAAGFLRAGASNRKWGDDDNDDYNDADDYED